MLAIFVCCDMVRILCVRRATWFLGVCLFVLYFYVVRVLCVRGGLDRSRDRSHAQAGRPPHDTGGRARLALFRRKHASRQGGRASKFIHARLASSVPKNKKHASTFIVFACMPLRPIHTGGRRGPSAPPCSPRRDAARASAPW